MPSDPSAPPVVLRSPSAVVAALPALVGFPPTDSLVVLCLADGHLVVTIRFDLPTEGGHWTDDVVATMERVETDDVILVVCSPKQAAPLPHASGVHALIAALRARHIEVRDALLVDDGRWWSFLCTADTCCPPEGHHVPADVSGLECEAVGIGLPAIADSRHALTERYRPRPDLAPSQDVVAQAAAILEVPVRERAQQIWDAVRMLATSSRLEDSEAADLLRARIQLAFGDVRVRDYVLAQTAAATTREDHLVDVIVQAALCAGDGHRAPVAAGAAALLAAMGPSSVPVRCLLDLAAGQSLADLVRASVDAAVPPSTLRAVLAQSLPAVLEQLAQAEDGIRRAS